MLSGAESSPRGWGELERLLAGRGWSGDRASLPSLHDELWRGLSEGARTVYVPRSKRATGRS